MKHTYETTVYLLDKPVNDIQFGVHSGSHVPTREAMTALTARVREAAVADERLSASEVLVVFWYNTDTYQMEVTVTEGADVERSQQVRTMVQSHMDELRTALGEARSKCVTADKSVFAYAYVVRYNDATDVEHDTSLDMVTMPMVEVTSSVLSFLNLFCGKC